MKANLETNALERYYVHKKEIPNSSQHIRESFKKDLGKIKSSFVNNYDYSPNSTNIFSLSYLNNWFRSSS
jgi:hypothetical protein